MTSTQLFRLYGTLAIPTAFEPEVEEVTSGLEDIVDWDNLEQRLMAGEFASKQALRQAAREMVTSAGVKPTRHMLERALIEGFCNLPVGTQMTANNPHQWPALAMRALFDALPDRGAITVATVHEVRRRRATGEDCSIIAAEMSLPISTVKHIAYGRTHKAVA